MRVLDQFEAVLDRSILVSREKELNLPLAVYRFVKNCVYHMVVVWKH